MRFLSFRRTLSVLLGFVFVVGLCATVGAQAANHRNFLWEIVTTCIDLHRADYCQHCSFPRTESPCGVGRGCNETTEVWGESADYVAIRDAKMCGCERGFVHGLAIPRGKVTGVEDPKRPDGIWDFAWGVAREHIGEESAIALAVNPPGGRSQDQLHVHIVRLQPDARNRFSDARSTRVGSLGGAWKAAADKASLAGLEDYGVLVVREPEGDFLVMVDESSPEKAYTLWKCR